MITIRPISSADRASWTPLWTGYLAYYETTLAPEIYDAQWARLMSDDPASMQGLLAEQGGHAIGLAHFHFHIHGWKLTDICYLQDLFTAPDVRGTGAGRALIEAVYAAADARGVPDVYWTTQHFNTTARRLYDRVGKQTPFIKYQRG